jgi:inorganic pyrophosphatase
VNIDNIAVAIVVDRFLYTTMFYPCNYGFILHTLAEDGDPVDVMVIGRIPVLPGAVLPARPVGVLRMRGGAGRQNPGGADRRGWGELEEAHRLILEAMARV